MKRSYEGLYRLIVSLHLPKSWVFGSWTGLLERLLDEDRIQPGRAIDLGCGVGVEAIFLARHGFDVTGVDISRTAIQAARRHAAAAGVDVEFLVDDLTRLSSINGPFDLLIDIGTLNDIRGRDRDLYMENVIPLTRPGSVFVLFGFEKHLSQREREALFSPAFAVETLEKRVEPVLRRRMITSVITRHSD